MNLANEYGRALIHESGHVFGNRAGGMENGTVVAFGNGSGRVGLATTSEFVSDEREVVACLAGSAAEHVFGFSSAPDCSRQDFERARSYARRHLGPGATRDEVDQLWDDCWDRAKNLVIGLMDEIEAFAETLQANDGRLAGYEVGQAIRHAVHHWPSPDFSRRGRYHLAVKQREIFEPLIHPGMSPDELRIAWERADEEARSERPPQGRQGGIPVPISTGSDDYNFDVMANQSRGRLLGWPAP
jgi:hypothetical protein